MHQTAGEGIDGCLPPPRPAFKRILGACIVVALKAYNQNIPTQFSSYIEL